MQSGELDDKIENFIKGSKAKETISKEKSDYKRFNQFLIDIEEPLVPINQLPPNKLDQLLCRFFMEAKKFNKNTRKYDGDEYQPDSLSSFKNSLQRVLQEMGSKLDLKTSNEFERSRKVLMSKRKGLVRNGYGNKPNATRPLEKEEIEQLKNMGHFGWNSTSSFTESYVVVHNNALRLSCTG